MQQLIRWNFGLKRCCADDFTWFTTLGLKVTVTSAIVWWWPYLWPRSLPSDQKPSDLDSYYCVRRLYWQTFSIWVVTNKKPMSGSIESIFRPAFWRTVLAIFRKCDVFKPVFNIWKHYYSKHENTENKYTTYQSESVASISVTTINRSNANYFYLKKNKCLINFKAAYIQIFVLLLTRVVKSLSRERLLFELTSRNKF